MYISSSSSFSDLLIQQVYIYKLYFAMTAAKHTVKGKEKREKEKKCTTYNS